MNLSLDSISPPPSSRTPSLPYTSVGSPTFTHSSICPLRPHLQYVTLKQMHSMEQSVNQPLNKTNALRKVIHILGVHLVTFLSFSIYCIILISDFLHGWQDEWALQPGVSQCRLLALTTRDNSPVPATYSTIDGTMNLQLPKKKHRREEGALGKREKVSPCGVRGRGGH